MKNTLSEALKVTIAVSIAFNHLMDESDYDYIGETLYVSEYLEKYDELVREYCEPKEENNFEMGM